MSAISLTDKGQQCCWLTERTESEPNSYCKQLPKPIKDYKDLTNHKQFISFYKEIFGLDEFKLISSIKIDNIVECSDGDFEYKLDFKLTDDDKNLLESENHCLNYT